MPTVTTFATLCARLNRAPVNVRGLQRRFALPLLDSAAYAAPYQAFLETIIHLRILGVSEEKLLRLWALERSLMHLLHADSTGSPTSSVDACGSTGNRDHRLLLSNFDIGAFLPSGHVQLGLNFSDEKPQELFTAPEMGEDAILILRQYITLHQEILRDIQMEHPIVRAALNHFPLARRGLAKNRKPSPQHKGGIGTIIPCEI